MADVWFYHLERRPLEQVLPALLEKTRARGWTAVVQATAPERVAALDALLWEFSEDSFLPHGAAGEGDEAAQPILLTAGRDNSNAADVRFFVDGAEAAPVLADSAAAPKERALVIFDGRDEDALGSARQQFRALREAGHTLSYWQQDSEGRWEKKA